MPLVELKPEVIIGQFVGTYERIIRPAMETGELGTSTIFIDELITRGSNALVKIPISRWPNGTNSRYIIALNYLPISEHHRRNSTLVKKLSVKYKQICK